MAAVAIADVDEKNLNNRILCCCKLKWNQWHHVSPKIAENSAV
jgi:hypothetical protein